MSTVVACPACFQNLTLPPDMVGQMVRCPSCAATFVAAAHDAAAEAAPPSTAVMSERPPPVPPPVPSSAPGEEEFAAPLDEEPASPRAEPDWDGPPKRTKRDKAGSSYFDELTRKQRKMQAPHRAFHILVLGICSIIFSCLCLLAIGACACGYYAYQMGAYDLGEMQVGRMDRSGEALTRVGWIMGICGMCLSSVGILFSMCALVRWLVLAATGAIRA